MSDKSKAVIISRTPLPDKIVATCGKWEAELVVTEHWHIKRDDRRVYFMIAPDEIDDLLRVLEAARDA